MSTTASITYWSTTLKTYCANWVTSMAADESYGIDERDACWENLELAVELISILDCYQPTTASAGIIRINDICFTDANETQIQKIFALASKVINGKCCD